MAKRVLLFAATTGYQIRVFEAAAKRLGLEAILATDRCDHLEDPWGDRALPVRAERPEEALRVLAAIHPKPDAIVAVGDRPAQIAAYAGEALGIPFHPSEAVEASRNKFLARERFRSAGLPVPEYFQIPVTHDAASAARRAAFPCVLKPLGLSGSRGVIRADDPASFALAMERIRTLLQSPDIRQRSDPQDTFLQVESYIPGREYAVEGLVTDGALHMLAIFDKPDPLEGPFFEETLYVTPSRSPAEVQNLLVQATVEGVRALGLRYGPVHAEMRYNDAGVWLLEIAARPIGGLCAGALRFANGVPLEELILRHALGEDITDLPRESAASGVMMIPIPRNGVFIAASGVEEARAAPYVSDLIISAKPGQRMLKLPEGASYLGFIFARADSPEQVEAALRTAHKRLTFEIAPELPVLRPS